MGEYPGQKVLNKIMLTDLLKHLENNINAKYYSNK